MRNLVFLVLLALLVGAFVGNLVASRRRRSSSWSVYETLAARLAEPSPAEAGRSPGIAGRIEAGPGAREAEGGIWGALGERLDPVRFRPELAPDVEVRAFRLPWGNDYAMIANPRELVHYRLEPGEVELLPLMDGTRTVGDIVVERVNASGGMELSGVADLVRQLRVGNFLTVPFHDVGLALGRAIDPVSPARARARRFVTTLTIEWQGAHRLVAWCYRYLLRWFFIPWVGGLAFLVAVAGGAAFWSVERSGRFSLAGESAAAASLLLLAMNYVLTFMHELGHASVLVHYGRRVKSAGFMIYFGSPAFFVDSSDGLMLGRRERILQSFAGPYVELIIAGAASLAVWRFPDWSGASVLYTFALLNYFVIFLNLVPMLELDGYWILSDAIQVPDLRPRSLRFLRYDLWHKLRRRERFTKPEVGLGLYAVLGVAFTIVSVWWSVIFWEEVFGGLVRALWDGGATGRLLLLALILFVLGPLIRGGIAVVRSLLRRARDVARTMRFRLQTRWRVEAATLIDALPMFDDLHEDVLSDLAGRVRLRSVPAGKAVFRQGDRPDAFYVVRRGVLHVVEEDRETGTTRVLRTLGRGESFGELGLVDGTPRAATVRAVVDTQVFEVDESAFDRLLADTIRVPHFAPTVQTLVELRRLPVFAALGADDLAEVLEHGSWVNVAPGETLIRRGEAGDAFFAIGSGRVEVIRDGEPPRTMGPGEHFGELALLAHVPRTATVVASTPARLFRLDRDGFDRAVAGAFRRGTVNPAAAIDRTWQH